MSLKKNKLLAILNMVSFLFHLALSQLTQLKLINSQTIGDVSDKYHTFFTPAGVTFAIWGIIYLALGIFCIYHLNKAFKSYETHEANIALLRTGYLFILNNVATGAWTIVWVYEWLLISVILILIQLVTLLAIQLSLGIFDPTRPPASRWFTQFPLSIYFGWICIAAIANISSALVGLQWSGLGLSPETWALLMIIIASLLSVFLIFNRRNPYVGLVTSWALYGIALKHQELNDLPSATIMATAWMCLIIVGMITIYQFYRNMQLSGSYIKP